VTSTVDRVRSFSGRVCRPESLYRLLFLFLILVFGSACSVRKYAINKLGDAFAGSGATFASDDDLQLIREATPFSLKLIESLILETPRHRGLLLAACRGFTQYTYAFVQGDSDELEDRDVAAAAVLRLRARRLYLRARVYGVRGLEVRYPRVGEALHKDAKDTVRLFSAKDVPWIYWTGAAWGATISVSKEDPETVADMPIVEALMDRALVLDEGFEQGAIHTFLITYEMIRPAGVGDAAARSRQHFDRAVELSGGLLASPFVAYAEAVSVSKQDRTEFQALLNRAIAIDVNAKPEYRLLNLLMQKRARWLLSRVDQLFVE
jgi:predicted anti-sigma-YlaC factor YlaD